MERVSTASTLLETAVAILEAEGPEALTVRRISQAAGMSTIGIYSHFSSKEGLVGAVWAHGFHDMRAALEGAVDPGVGAVVSLAGRYLEWAHAHPHLYRLMFGGAASGMVIDDDARSVSRAGFDVLVEACAAVTPAPESAALAVWRYLHGVASLAIAGVAPPGLVAEVDHAEVIRRILGSGHPPPSG